MTDELQGTTTPEPAEAETTEASTPSEDTKEADEQVSEEQDTKEVELTETEKAVKEVKDATQKRINRQTAANRDLNKKYSEAMEKIHALEESSKPESDDKAPSEEDYETTDEFIQARADYAAQKKFEELKAEDKVKTQQETQVKAYAEAKKAFDAQEAKFRVDIPDYDEVAEVFNEAVGALDPQDPALKAVSSALLDSDNMPMLGYYLGNNPDEIDRILELSPNKAYREIIKLEMKIEQENIVPKTKKLPKPPSPGGGAGKVSKGLASKSPKEIMAWVNS